MHGLENFNSSNSYGRFSLKEQFQTEREGSGSHGVGGVGWEEVPDTV